MSEPIVYKITADMDHLSKIYHWLCNHWPASSDWEILTERINWKTGDLTVEYVFKSQDKSLLFCLVWMDQYTH